MINYTTQIDTVVLQIDNDTKERQRHRIELLYQWIGTRKIATMKYNETDKKYYLYYRRTILATISTGYSNLKYYITIKVAGLKRYDNSIDKVSKNCLLSICALLNTADISFSLAELDIAIDINAPFENVLAICTKKSPNVKYKNIGVINQFKNGIPTTYLEYFDTKKKVENASLRSYLYNKTAKEELGFNMTRFELKFQNRYFNRSGFSIQSILDALSRYYVMYFSDLYKKNYIVNKCQDYSNIYKREIDRLGLNCYRLNPNRQVIADFIGQIQSVYVNFGGSIAFK